MKMWLYQLNQTKWPPELFRRDIWEGQAWHFRCGQVRYGDQTISSRSENAPKLGDIVVFFYCEAGGEPDPGIYGWGVVDRIEKNLDLSGDSEFEDRLYFIPSTPTNHLKMDPWWDGDAKKIVNAIRGGMTMATLFYRAEANLTGTDATQSIRNGIKKWLR